MAENLRFHIAQTIYDVGNKWVAPNFGPDWKPRPIETDEYAQRLHLDYADTLLAGPLSAALAEAEARARRAGIERAAEAYEAHDKTGREWIKGSLWDTLNREGAARVRALASTAPAETEINKQIAGCPTCGREDKLVCKDGAEADECIAQTMLDQFGTRSDAEITRILAMSDKDILASVTCENIKALQAERDAAVAEAIAARSDAIGWHQDYKRERREKNAALTDRRAPQVPASSPGLVAALIDVATWLENDGRYKHARHVRAGIAVLAATATREDGHA